MGVFVNNDSNATSNASNTAVSAAPAPETLVRLPAVGSEAERALVEVMARAICAANWPGVSISGIDEMWDAWIPDATAALSAIMRVGREGR